MTKAAERVEEFVAVIRDLKAKPAPILRAEVYRALKAREQTDLFAPQSTEPK